MYQEKSYFPHFMARRQSRISVRLPAGLSEAPSVGLSVGISIDLSEALLALQHSNEISYQCPIWRKQTILQGQEIC